MKLTLKRLIISFFVFCSSLGFVLAWNGLIAQNGDLLNLTKWNELVSELQNKLAGSDLQAGTNISLTYSGSAVTINSSGGGSIPYISNSLPISIGPGVTKNIILNGSNFTPTTSISIPGFDGSINSVSAISPSQLQANITTGTNQSLYDIVVSNGGVLNTLWAGNGLSLLDVMLIIGTGPAGTYNETFEANNLGNWTAVTGLTANVSFQTVTGGTPSGATGPNNAAAGSYYMYTEASNPNFPSMTFAVETSHFRNAQSIAFDYHMFGADMGTLVIQTFYGGIWTDVYTLSGQQQTAQANAWLNTGNIDLSSYGVEKIRFFYTSGADYTGDLSIDNVIITSI